MADATAHRPALVWERRNVPEDVEAIIPPCDHERVVWLPAGAGLYEHFWFMESAAFLAGACDEHTYLHLNDGSQLILIGTNLYYLADDYDENEDKQRHQERPATHLNVDAPAPKADQPQAIQVWCHDDTPQQWADLVMLGGDEDWVAFVPDTFLGQLAPSWLDAGSSFGVSSVTDFEVDGGTLYVSQHA
jgi:hypothetical protein